MSQTDRQTDKATWWSVTAYNDEIERLEDTTTYPPDVIKVWGGREECPTTKRVHFQGCIQLRKQQRRAWLKSWLPTAHLEPAIQKEALKKYAMKADTATGEKLERSNTVKYYSADEICLLIGSKVTDEIMMRSADHKDWFKASINILLRENVRLAGQLMNPSLRSFWCDTAYVWIDKSRENVIVDDGITYAEFKESFDNQMD